MHGSRSPEEGASLAPTVILSLSLVFGAERVGRSDSPLEVQDGEAAEVARLLRSIDPRNQAWGAWRSGRWLLHEMTPLLIDVVAQRVGSSGTWDTVALDTALDALIQLEAEAPVELLQVLHERRPAQALVLLSRHGDDAVGALLTIVTENLDLSWFAAANLLLKQDRPGLTKAVLSGLELQAAVVVTDGQLVGIGSGVGGGIGCGVVRTAPEGSPPWAGYQLTVSAAPGVVVLAFGPKPVYYRRVVSTTGRDPRGGCHSRSAPTATHRIADLAALLNIPPEQLPVRGSERFSLVWTGTADLQASLGRFRRDVHRRYRQLLQRLEYAGLLTAEDAAALSSPHVGWTIHDARDDKSMPLRATR